MPTARRRRTSWAIAASALAHLAVLVVALLQKPMLPLPPAEFAGPPQAIIPILLLPRAPARTAGGPPQPGELRLHRRPQRPIEGALPVAPLPAAPAPTRPAERAATPASAPAGQAPGASGGPDLSLALRHGAAGCANASLVGMSRAERERCDERLGRAMASAPYLPAAIEPRIRAYYDAVAEAKKPDPQPVHPALEGGFGPAQMDRAFGLSDARGANGHGPAVGCRVIFGVGKKPNDLPNALKLGPCYIEPPKGPLTPEVDIPLP